jgi:carbonic anhydrase
MSSTQTLLHRNAQFAESFSGAELPIIPSLRSVILTCTDARVDPAHIFALELGETVVMRNNGGRLTPAALDEIITLALLVAAMDGESPGPFNLVIVQHTRCGAERFADPGIQAMIRERAGVDVAASAIHDHHECLQSDVDRLRDDPRVPGHISVSALLYDTETGRIEQVVDPVAVGELRSFS